MDFVPPNCDIWPIVDRVMHEIIVQVQAMARTSDRAVRHELIALLAGVLADMIDVDIPMLPNRRQRLIDDLVALEYIAIRQGDGPPKDGYNQLVDLTKRENWK